MLPGFLVCTMVVMAGAMAVNKPTHGPFRMPVGRVSDEEHHEPCEFPPYFTFEQDTILTSAYGGKLQVENIFFEGAYDDIAKKFAAKVDIDFFNGTDDYFKNIEDYEKGKQYFIYKSGETIHCISIDVEGQRFPQEYFIPDTAKFFGEQTIGDRDLVVENWYQAEGNGSVHVMKTVTQGECVPVGYLRRVVDPETGDEVAMVENQLRNFRLGICDPEKYFKIPEECQQENALKKPIAKMQKLVQKMRRFHLA